MSVIVIVIHRLNRSEPRNSLRMCRRSFASETEAEEYGWRRARSGALMLRQRGGQWEGRYPCRVCLTRPDANHVSCRTWMPLSAFSVWEDGVTTTPIDILLVVSRALMPVRTNSEGIIVQS